MVGNGEELPHKTVEEIHRETDEELAYAAHLAKEAEIGKRHNGLQDDSGASKDEPWETPPEVQFTAHNRLRLTPEPVLINP
jgi:hypothetical protein